MDDIWGELEVLDEIFVFKEGEYVRIGELQQITFKIDGSIDLNIFPE